MSVKPTEQEDEYFARLERQRTLSVVRGRCPKCGAELIPVPHRGIELDKCSRCQGVSLDFGELDQVVTEDTGLFGSVRRIFR